MPLAALCLALLAPLDQTQTTLTRKFAANEKLAYAIRSHLTSEQRQRGLQTWLPSDTDINYNFNVFVRAIQADGFAVVHYTRPTMTIIEDETGDPKTTVQKSNINVRMLLSPVNEMIDARDLNPPKPKKASGASSDDDQGGQMVGPEDGTAYALAVFGQFASEAERLALFIGSLDSSLDFSPKLPLTAVKVGDTWQRTIGYQPQKLKGKEGKSAVQRLDYTFTYQGPKVVDGKTILRIQAKLDFKTDLLDYVKSIMEEVGGGTKTILSSLPLNLKATIDYDLDPVTRHTLATRATSEGGYGLFLKGDTDALVEGRYKGRTDMDLVGRKLNAKE